MKSRFNKIIFPAILFVGIFALNSAAQTTASLDATLSFKSINGVPVPFQNGMPVPSYEKQNRTTINLAGTWKKLRFAASDSLSLLKRDEAGLTSLLAEAGGKELPGFDDSGWQDKQIPSVENYLYPDTIRTPEFYENGVWYRYNFNVADSLQGKFVKLIFYSVNYVADVWINGQYCGYHEGGYTPFAFDVSSKLNFGATTNSLVVRVDNPVWGARKDIVPYKQCDWFNYTGIIHDVYLEASENISVVRADFNTDGINKKVKFNGILYNKTGSSKAVTATVQVYSANINAGNISNENTYELLGTPGSSLAYNLTLQDSVTAFTGEFAMGEFQPWSMKSPNLYIAKVTVEEGGKVVDEFCTQFGVRTIETSGDKLLLNGNPVFLPGVARHEDHPLYGRSVPKDTIFTDLQKVKDIKALYLRTAHYPNHPYTYLISDRLGIAVWEEIPVFWFDEVESWNIQNNVRHIHQQMFREMVLKDFNRPSIFFWSLQNESLVEQERKTYIQSIREDRDLNLKDGRLLTQSPAADRPGAMDVSQQPCDVASWTMYFGIFHGGTYYSGTSSFLAQAKINNPGKPIMDSEFGYWSTEDGSSSAKQVTVFNETYKAFKLFPTVSEYGKYNPNGMLNGITWWCIFDWYTAGQRFGYQSMGLISMDRSTLKPVGETLKNTYKLYYDFGGTVTDVEEDKNVIPESFELNQNYPNPFNPSTVISYQLPENSFVTIKIFNILGKEVATLVNETQKVGKYSIKFETKNNLASGVSAKGGYASGVYFYQLHAGDFIQTRKMLLLR
ncbi:MAG: glycoside hydrolase family 2 TIM barrel-domain containing protein [Ignavibacteria bacterium]|nr:glycoside hydrolase family 2 TIM barrel-domain containing protein [Ignavibacteria bacterium]